MKQNPLYLLSALCMLIGCYLVSGAAEGQDGRLLDLLPAVGWVTAYELSLIALAIVLDRRGAHRDARILLVLETVFLVDATHLLAGTTTSTEAAWPWCLGFAGLTTLKGAMIVRGLRLRSENIGMWFAAGTLGLILCVPAGLAGLRQSGLALELPLYGGAWVLGLMLAAEGLARRTPKRFDTRTPIERTLGTALRVALPASLFGHLLAAHWLYDTPYPVCSLAPPLLGLCLFMIRSDAAEGAWPLRAALPMVAAALSLNAPEVLHLDLGFPLSPLRSALLLAGLVYLYDFRYHRQLFAAALAAACVGVAAGGHTLAGAHAAWAGLAHSATQRTGWLWPRGARHWGWLCMMAAYALLALGGWRTLRRGGNDAGAGAAPTRPRRLPPRVSA